MKFFASIALAGLFLSPISFAKDLLPSLPFDVCSAANHCKIFSSVVKDGDALYFGFSYATEEGLMTDRETAVKIVKYSLSRKQVEWASLVDSKYFASGEYPKDLKLNKIRRTKGLSSSFSAIHACLVNITDSDDSDLEVKNILLEDHDGFFRDLKNGSRVKNDQDPFTACSDKMNSN